MRVSKTENQKRVESDLQNEAGAYSTIPNPPPYRTYSSSYTIQNASDYGRTLTTVMGAGTDTVIPATILEFV